MAKQKNLSKNNVDKAVIEKQNENIISDFLLQFAYTLSLGFFTIFIFNGITYKYGDKSHFTMEKLSAFLCAASFIIGIISLVWYKIKNRKGFKILGIYSLITTLVSLVYISNKIVDFLGVNFIAKLYPGTEKTIFMLFPLLGIALVVEFIVYFVRYYKVNKKKKK